MIVKRETWTDVSTVSKIGEMSNTANRVYGRCVRNDMAPRPIVSTARHGNVDQTRIPLFDGFPVQPPTIEDSCAVVLN